MQAGIRAPRGLKQSLWLVGYTCVFIHGNEQASGLGEQRSNAYFDRAHSAVTTVLVAVGAYQISARRLFSLNI